MQSSRALPMKTVDFQHQMIKYHFNEEIIFSGLLINSGADHALHFTFLKKRERFIEYIKLKLGTANLHIATENKNKLIRLSLERSRTSVCQSLTIRNYDIEIGETVLKSIYVTMEEFS